MKKPRAEENKDVNGRTSAGFSILDKTLLCHLISMIIYLKRVDIGTQPEFQSHNTFGEQVVREQNSQQVLMLLSER